MEISFFLFLILFMSTIQVDGIFFRLPKLPPVQPVYSSYDFVIVGAGSSGTALARRLSENPRWRILLLEVGKRPTIVSDIPILAPTLQFTDFVWNYKMEKTPGVCLGMEEQRCPWPRGRGLGGSSLINYMIYTRGHRKDFERWKNLGNPGYGYDDILPYYLKSEDVNLELLEPNFHRKGGPLSVEDTRWRSRVVEDIIKAGQDIGYPYVDYNGHSQTGFSFVQANTRKGVRASGFRAFLAPVETRRNLDILTEARVTKLLINPDTKQVYGVEYVKNRKYQYVNVTKEVILSAGAFNSPQLLMLSGIGPRSHLESLSIPVLEDLPVGRNLHDHITFLGLLFFHETGNTGLAAPEELQSLSTILQWIEFGRGPLTSLGGVEALAYINTNTSTKIVSKDMPDMELIILNGRMDASSLEILRKTVGVKKEIFNSVFSKEMEGKHLTVILPMHLKPHSIGHLELKSRDPYHWPKFYGNHLTDPDNLDVAAFISTARFAQKLMSAPSLSKYSTRQVTTPVLGCHTLEWDSDAYWECAIRHISTTLHHQVGTCKMASRENGGVVNHEFKVHGIKGIRVADTSVIPFALNAHTNAPAFMLGEKLSDVLKEYYKS